MRWRERDTQRNVPSQQLQALQARGRVSAATGCACVTHGRTSSFIASAAASMSPTRRSHSSAAVSWAVHRDSRAHCAAAAQSACRERA